MVAIVLLTAVARFRPLDGPDTREEGLGVSAGASQGKNRTLDQRLRERGISPFRVHSLLVEPLRERLGRHHRVDELPPQNAEWHELKAPTSMTVSQGSLIGFHYPYLIHRACRLACLDVGYGLLDHLT